MKPENKDNEFDSLVGDLDELAKSIDNTDEDIDDDAAAVGDEGAGGDDADAEIHAAASEDDDDKDGDDDGELVKSMKLIDENGEPVEAFDGAEILKAMMNENKELAGKQGLFAEQSKSAMTATMKAVLAQGKMLKSMKASIDAMSNLGRGRKSTIDLHEPGGDKPDGDEAQTISRQDLLQKAASARNAGRMTGIEVIRIEGYLNANSKVPDELLRKAVGE